MTLKLFHSDIVSNYPSRGVKEVDPQKDTLYRNRIIEKLDYLSKTVKEVEASDAYKFCKDELDKRSKEIPDIIKEIRSKIAQTNIMLEQSKHDKIDENIYKSALKAYETFISYLEEGQYDDNQL